MLRLDVVQDAETQGTPGSRIHDRLRARGMIERGHEIFASQVGINGKGRGGPANIIIICSLSHYRFNFIIKALELLLFCIGLVLNSTY